MKRYKYTDHHATLTLLLDDERMSVQLSDDAHSLDVELPAVNVLHLISWLSNAHFGDYDSDFVTAGVYTPPTVPIGRIVGDVNVTDTPTIMRGLADVALRHQSSFAALALQAREKARAAIRDEMPVEAQHWIDTAEAAERASRDTPS
jgi:hypothetical protein